MPSENILGKEENAGCNQHFPLILIFFFGPFQKQKFKFKVALILSSACALNFDQSKILSFGKELNIVKTFYLLATFTYQI